ncbi:MarR family winged helix-turn-helix transcriptional regulator [Streptomyces sp. NPDC002680]|uniref:MarR family winged helix-turn-helix transcriptional regulator n=1 Tax=Streptomyces sp. NPDC002680 TaxID=3364659 RepID=UPI0036C82B9D
MRAEQADALNQLIRRISIKHRTHTAALLADLKMHPGQDVILLELAERGPCTQVQLATAAGCEPPTVTNMVRKLSAAGLVSRAASATDGRAVVVTLTDQGRAVVPEIRRLGKSLAEHIVSGLSAASGEELLELLEDLERVLREPLPGAAGSRPERPGPTGGRKG